MSKTLASTGGFTMQSIGGAEKEAMIFRNRINGSEDNLVLTGNKFYVSQNGNDNNDGTSPEKAFKTLARVLKLGNTLKAGDGVLFERDSVFRTSSDFNLVSGVTYGAYGEGKKPEIWGSEKNYAQSSLWSQTETKNVWKICFEFSDAGIIVLNGGSETGKKQMYLYELTENDDFYHDWDEKILYFYCDMGNPGEVFSDIEIGIKTRIFQLPAESHDIIIDNIGFCYSGLFGIRSAGKAKNITVSNCAFTFIGGSLFDNKSNRFGNAVEFAAGCEDITVENCFFDQIFDSGVTFQIEKSPYRNFTVENCLFEYNGMSGFEWWTGGDEGEKDGKPIDITEIENICIKNNIIRFTGFGWSKATRSPAHIRNGWRDKWYPHMKNFVIKNNVFDCVNGQIIASPWSVAPESFSVSGNTYYQGRCNNISNYGELILSVGKTDDSPKKIEWVLDMNNNFDKRIEDILSHMTLKEKIGQLNQITGPLREDQIESIKESIRNGEVGSIILASSSTAGNDKQGHVNVELYNELQRVAVEESRTHIPMIYGRDVIHGHRTVYPIPLGSAAAFNPGLLEKCYRNIAKEATADGIHWTFSPMLDMCHDPRWGRVIEGPGEDPYVGAMMAKACVKGFQGDDISAEDSIVACAKHYIGYGASEGGRDYHRTEISDSTLYNNYIPAFRAAVEAGVGTVMSSFNDINGIPTTGSKKYLTDILRGKLGFEGFVVSDWCAVEQLEKQGYAENRADCARIALNAGLDLNMCDKCYIENLEQLVNNGDVAEETVNEAVRRILRIKSELGLFENPYRENKEIDRTEHIKDARSLASESMVLLKNNGVLPLKKDSKIALIGPFARERRSLLGSWTLDGKAEETQNLYEALCDAIGNKNVYCQGEEFSVYNGAPYLYADADTIVLALGESNLVTGENRAVSDISLNSAQIELIKSMRAVGKKVVGVFFCGRPIAMEGVADNLDAVLYAWHSGSQTAEAVCDILFGDTVPSGKTAITFPRKSGHIPLYYNVTSSGRPVNCYYGENPQNCYIDSIPTPYYPFGYGLSYTTFEYSKPTFDKSEISVEDLKAGKTFNISAVIKNTGDFDAKETVQLYIRDKVASIMRPMRELKGFEKPFIKKGESVAVQFELGYGNLGFYNENGEYVLEKGEFEIFVGENCLTENLVTVRVI